MAPPLPVQRLVLTCLTACAPTPGVVEPPSAYQSVGSTPEFANDLESETVEVERTARPDDKDGHYLASPPEDRTTTDIVPRVTTSDDRATAVGLDVDIVLRLVSARINRLRYCYAVALKGNPHVTGTATLTWSLDEAGYARSPSLVESTLDDDGLHACLVAAVDGDRFPRPNEKPASATVEFKFVPE